MRTATSAILAAASIAATAAMASAAGSNSFPRVRDLLPPAAAAGEIASSVLDADIYDHLADRMGNLRLFDDKGVEQPSLIRLRIPVRTRTWEREFAIPAAAAEFRDLGDNSVEIVFRRDPAQPPAAGLRLESGVRNFEKMVTVSARSEGGDWADLVSSEPIYDYSRFVDVRRDTIRFPPSNHTLFRLHISNITENKDSPLVEIIRQTRGAGKADETEATSFRKEPFRIERLVFIERVSETARQGDPKTAFSRLSGKDLIVGQAPESKETWLTFSTRREPLVSLSFDTTDINFSRRVVVLGTDDQSWKTSRRIASGCIARIKAGRVTQEDLKITFPAESRCRYYKVLIQDQDNPPINIESIETERRCYEVLFFPKAGSKYSAAYGGNDIVPANYDIASVLAACPVENTSPWTLAPAQDNPFFTQPRESGLNGKKLLTIAVVAMVIILAFLIATLVRKVETVPKDIAD